jgi:hypothetical protein
MSRDEQEAEIVRLIAGGSADAIAGERQSAKAGNAFRIARVLLDAPGVVSAGELHEAEEAHLADIAEVRRALRFITGDWTDQHYRGVYARAGGGYEGLQAVAREFLLTLTPRGRADGVSGGD